MSTISRRTKSVDFEVAMPVIHASNASCLVVHQYTHGLQGFSCLGVRKTTKLPMPWFEKASKTWPHGIFSLGFGVCKYFWKTEMGGGGGFLLALITFHSEIQNTNTLERT